MVAYRSVRYSLGTCVLSAFLLATIVALVVSVSAFAHFIDLQNRRGYATQIAANVFRQIQEAEGRPSVTLGSRYGVPVAKRHGLWSQELQYSDVLKQDTGDSAVLIVDWRQSPKQAEKYVVELDDDSIWITTLDGRRLERVYSMADFSIIRLRGSVTVVDRRLEADELRKMLLKDM